jgi:hypothetical protein
MMAQFGLNFGNPSNFADWTQYAGFDPNQAMIGLPAKKTPIKPPSMSDMTKTMSNIGSHLSKGNYSDAYKAYTTGVVPSTSATVQQTMPDDGMSHEFED